MNLDDSIQVRITPHPAEKHSAGWDELYMKKMAFKLAMVVLIVGALNWLAIGLVGFNAVEKVFGKFSRIVYFLVGLAAFTVMFNRDTYLPFLGETVLPCAAIPEHTPEGADTQLKVQVTPGSKVLYWAAEPATEGLKELKDWRGAYLKYMNSGVVKADESGTAVLSVRRPQPYRVPWKGRLEPHVHFRICGPDGMLSRIKTVFVSHPAGSWMGNRSKLAGASLESSDGRVEGFADL